MIKQPRPTRPERPLIIHPDHFQKIFWLNYEDKAILLEVLISHSWGIDEDEIDMPLPLYSLYQDIISNTEKANQLMVDIENYREVR